MAATPLRTPGAIFRAVGIVDSLLGVALGVFGEMVVALGEIVPGVPTWVLVGGVLVLSGLGIIALGIALDRRQRPAPPSADDAPVRRE
jgi:hypothetical protein